MRRRKEKEERKREKFAKFVMHAASARASGRRLDSPNHAVFSWDRRPEAESVCVCAPPLPAHKGEPDGFGAETVD